MKKAQKKIISGKKAQQKLFSVKKSQQKIISVEKAQQKIISVEKAQKKIISVKKIQQKIISVEKHEQKIVSKKHNPITCTSCRSRYNYNEDTTHMCLTYSGLGLKTFRAILQYITTFHIEMNHWMVKSIIFM